MLTDGTGSRLTESFAAEGENTSKKFRGWGRGGRKPFDLHQACDMKHEVEGK